MAQLIIRVHSLDLHCLTKFMLAAIEVILGLGSKSEHYQVTNLKHVICFRFLCGLFQGEVGGGGGWSFAQEMQWFWCYHMLTIMLHVLAHGGFFPLDFITLQPFLVWFMEYCIHKLT
jgi:hypothetical protein